MRKARLAGFIAILIVVILAGSLLAYSQEWPPVSVVASESMTHSSSWMPGTLNVGDIVFVKKVDQVPGPVISYVVGRETGYMSYGEYGNVILYHSTNGIVIIHRAMFYLTWNGSTPVVQGYHNQSWMRVTDQYVWIEDASYNGRNLTVSISAFRGESGFITVGDHNLATSAIYVASQHAYIAADQNVNITAFPVSSSEIVGIAFGDIPWFGLIKLNLLRLFNQWPEYNQVAKYSYDYLGLSILAILVVIFFPYGMTARYISQRKRPR
jgi:signal peptidase